MDDVKSLLVLGLVLLIPVMAVDDARQLEMSYSFENPEEDCEIQVDFLPFGTCSLCFYEASGEQYCVFEGRNYGALSAEKSECVNLSGVMPEIVSGSYTIELWCEYQGGKKYISRNFQPVMNLDYRLDLVCRPGLGDRLIMSWDDAGNCTTKIKVRGKSESVYVTRGVKGSVREVVRLGKLYENVTDGVYEGWLDCRAGEKILQGNCTFEVKGGRTKGVVAGWLEDLKTRLSWFSRFRLGRK
ncbi:MAG TPA: hypothetical protein ENN60_03855 [archaeon]|nr:hypothetical protein [archaeon]